jgi:hypothetical protein
MDAVEPTLTPGDALAKVIRYYRNHWDALFRFVDHPEIPIDNSGSEREFQNFAKLRLNCLFAGSSEGAHQGAGPTRNRRYVPRPRRGHARLPELGLHPGRHAQRYLRPHRSQAHSRRLRVGPRWTPTELSGAAFRPAI